jgi:hypothetical protein
VRLKPYTQSSFKDVDHNQVYFPEAVPFRTSLRLSQIESLKLVPNGTAWFYFYKTFLEAVPLGTSLKSHQADPGPSGTAELFGLKMKSQDVPHRISLKKKSLQADPVWGSLF